jgi:glycosyltransferase involved in cell wall biosynthesis
MKQSIVEEYGFGNSKVAVIPNYVLTDLFRPDPDVTPRPGRIYFVGRLHPEKNLLALLNAVDGLDVELEFIGDGPQAEVLRTAARERGVDARFLGNRAHAELPRHFNAAEIVILPSLYEGHPKVLLEAMACGRPVIGTDVVGIRELIRHGENGYLCGTSPEEIRSAIRTLLADQALRERIGRRARDFVVERFSLDSVV